MWSCGSSSPEFKTLFCYWYKKILLCRRSTRQIRRSTNKNADFGVSKLEIRASTENICCVRDTACPAKDTIFRRNYFRVGVLRTRRVPLRISLPGNKVAKNVIKCPLNKDRYDIPGSDIVQVPLYLLTAKYSEYSVLVLVLVLWYYEYWITLRHFRHCSTGRSMAIRVAHA